MADSRNRDDSQKSDPWPGLPLEAWQDTYATLHMWMQIVGKIRLAQTPLVNHWWNVPLYLTARGLTTSAMPYRGRSFEIEFDFIDHRLVIRCDDGTTRSIALAPRSVADFYRQLMQTLAEIGITVNIWPVPVEVPDPIPFEEDKNDAYSPESVNRFWHVLLRIGEVLEAFRARFIGKCSPVHFFWGSFDLAVTRFSGRPAPPREGADAITREAYSHEVISHGFWPGIRASGPVERPAAAGSIHYPAFYAYAAPEPAGFREAPVRPGQAFYSQALKEFILPYDAVRTADSPEDTLMAFVQSTYAAGADLAGWDRAALERMPGDKTY
jgi:hypothetical protein